MKTTLALAVLAVLLLVGGSLWSGSLQSSDAEVIARNGIHWHPLLDIYVKGRKVEIPANVGVGPQYAGKPTFDAGMRMTAVHTHDDMPVIHLEFPGLVRKDDIKLGSFFRIWEKDMRSFGSNIRMTVNGVESSDLEEYPMRDGDKIELYYE